ncbi:MAG: hypothetical protein QOJ12_1811 [Thermoleophilales bacterium]|jgi:hypothetical protein|nr:hypothetical protein [Thermoleophilales bacterium]
MDVKKPAVPEYEKPTVTDYGDLAELTAQGGGGFSDTPVGNPIGNPTGKSQP